LATVEFELISGEKLLCENCDKTLDWEWKIEIIQKLTKEK
jgi:hypothetical protein